MGKGSTYPDLFGTVGILFEQPSSRGAGQDTVNGKLTFPFSISNQFRASLSSIKATSALRDALLNYQRDFYTQQKRKRGHYLRAKWRPHPLSRVRSHFERTPDRGRSTTSDITAEGKTFKAGDAIAIPLDQPGDLSRNPLARAARIRGERFLRRVDLDTAMGVQPLAHAKRQKR